jgi:hypothetical protein
MVSLSGMLPPCRKDVPGAPLGKFLANGSARD